MSMLPEQWIINLSTVLIILKQWKASIVTSHPSLADRPIYNWSSPRFPWPPSPRPEDLNLENVNYAEELEQLIDAIFKNRPDRLKLSIMQDLFYNVTQACVKTPKSVLLPSIVKNLTCNTKMINILNKLGHGICYTLTTEI